ncbi:MAG: pyridoxal-phosphate dependent enzyme [Planctomycetota bacterium]|jgi:threonine dehydratase
MWLNENLQPTDWDGAFPELDFEAAASRIGEVVPPTPLVPLPGSIPGVFDLRGKMENRQVTGSFKARGALNNMLRLTEEERALGVVASSSGNHGRALAWAARRVGVAAAVVMPEDAYPNKIEACRAEEAEVVLAPDRWQADVVAERMAGEGRLWVHPYDRPGTVEGAGTVGLELAADWPEVEVVVVCIGGGGLSAGSALALRRSLGAGVVILGAEPVGAAAMVAAQRAGRSVHLDTITSQVQGLTTTYAGHLNVEVCRATLDGIITVDDEAILAAQRRLVNPEEAAGWSGEVVEPAGAAAYAAALSDDLCELVTAARERRGLSTEPCGAMGVAVTISGGNPAPDQLEAQRT